MSWPQVAAKLEQQCGDIATFRGEPFTKVFLRGDASADADRSTESSSEDSEEASEEDALDAALREHEAATYSLGADKHGGKGDSQAALAGAARALFSSIDVDGDGAISQVAVWTKTGGRDESFGVCDRHQRVQ